ncbi:MAG: hypothetical protein AAF798_11450 [Bacteroidota bacterium]
MITIEYVQPNTTIVKWQEQLQEWVISHQIVQNEHLREPKLTEENIVVEGEKAIERHLKEIERELLDWRTHRCGV